MYRAQLVMDATMAESIAAASRAGAVKVVHLVGHFHCDFEGGLIQELRRRLPDDLPLDRIVVTGGGQHNGMLLREIAARLSPIPVSPLGKLGITDDALEPACVALLALFHLDQVPGNLSAVTGAEIPRVLGRLTPGSPQSWRRLLHQMAGAEPTIRPLRSAL